MLVLEIGIADRGDFSFDKFFLYFNVKKKHVRRVEQSLQNNQSSYSTWIYGAFNSLGKIKVWISFSPWSCFTFLIFHQSANINRMRICFFNTAIIIFCLIYSLNIPHSNQNSSFFPVEGLSISSKMTFRRYFTLLYLVSSEVVTRK